MQTYIGLHALLCYTNLLRKTIIYHTFTFCFISTHSWLLKWFWLSFARRKKNQCIYCFSIIPKHFKPGKFETYLSPIKFQSLCSSPVSSSRSHLAGLLLHSLCTVPDLPFWASVLSIRPKYLVILRAFDLTRNSGAFYLDWPLRLLPGPNHLATSLEHPVILIFSSRSLTEINWRLCPKSIVKCTIALSWT